MNPDLVIPAFIAFLVMRLQALFNFPQIMLQGLRFFVTNDAEQASRTVGSSNRKTRVHSLEEVLSKLQLTMIELNSSMQSVRLLTSLLLYNVYDALVIIFLCTILVHAWSAGYHCIYPELDYSCWSTLLVLVAAGFALQSQLYVLILTGFAARETKIAIAFGVTVFAVTATLSGLCPWVIHTDYDRLVLDASAEHANALLMQFSVHPPVIPIATVLKPLVIMLISMLLGIVGTGMIFPAMRFAESFVSIVLGGPFRDQKMGSKDRKDGAIKAGAAPAQPTAPVPARAAKPVNPSTADNAEPSINRSKIAVRIALVLDYLLPAAVAALTYVSAYSPVLFAPENGNCAADNSEIETCQANNESQSLYRVTFTVQNILFTAIMVLVVILVSVRLFCMKAHIQSFLDAVVKAVASQLVAVPVGALETSAAAIAKKELQFKVKARSAYIAAAALQYTALPAFLLALLILLHKSSPTGTGLCHLGHQVIAGLSPAAPEISHLDPETDFPLFAIETSIARAALYNPTQTARDLAPFPYFTDAFQSVLGSATSSSVNVDQTQSTELTKAFLSKISNVYYLPHETAVLSAQLLLFVSTLMWFFLYTAAIVCWAMAPEIFVSKKVIDVSPAGSATAAASMQATAASRPAGLATQ